MNHLEVNLHLQQCQENFDESVHNSCKMTNHSVNLVQNRICVPNPTPRKVILPPFFPASLSLPPIYHTRKDIHVPILAI